MRAAIDRSCWIAPFATALLALVACREPEPAGPNVGTNSNWLRKCSTDEQCGDLPACRCAACTAECEQDSDCDALGEGRCLRDGDPSVRATCETEEPNLPRGICMPSCEPGSCGEGRACVGGFCARLELPDIPFCASAAQATMEDRAAEDALLELYSDLRAGGGATCGGGAASAPVPELRLDGRLVCEARVLAADIATSRRPGATDSMGRTAEDRLRMVGYTQQLWAESYAIDASTAGRALQLILADPGSCMRLTSTGYAEVGVGSAGDVHVIVIGRD